MRRSRSSTWSVTDSRLDDAVRPVFLTFAGEIEPGEPFAHMIENRAIAALEALERRAASNAADRRRAFSTAREGVRRSRRQRPLNRERADGHRSAQHVDVGLANGDTIAARLLVAADGARSSIREGAGIATHGWELRPVGDRHHGQPRARS